MVVAVDAVVVIDVVAVDAVLAVAVVDVAAVVIDVVAAFVVIAVAKNADIVVDVDIDVVVHGCFSCCCCSVEFQLSSACIRAQPKSLRQAHVKHYYCGFFIIRIVRVDVCQSAVAVGVFVDAKFDIIKDCRDMNLSGWQLQPKFLNCQAIDASGEKATVDTTVDANLPATVYAII